LSLHSQENQIVDCAEDKFAVAVVVVVVVVAAFGLPTDKVWMGY
jgi:hypothetical protein